VQSRAAKLTVNDGRPVITKHPRDTMVLENSAWTMSVTATGQPTLSYAWYKTGNPPIKLGTNNRVLTVSSALLSDAGSYYCIVSNTFGACTSNVGNLSVSRNQQVSNPIQLSGQLIDSTNVLLTISRYDDLPTTAEPGFPWYADTVMVWYRVALFPAPPPNRTTANFKFLVTALKAAGTAFQTIVTVPKLATCQNYCFKGSVNWRNTQLMRDSIPPFGLDASGARVYMCDTTRIANPLTMAYAGTLPST
jgi:hypothetical protein